MITCNVTGSQVLAWEYGGDRVHFSSGEADPKSIGPFNFTLLYLDNDTVISIAVLVNVSASINGSTIECRNTIPAISSSIRQYINFSVKSKWVLKVALYSIFGWSAQEGLTKMLFATNSEKEREREREREGESERE